MIEVGEADALLDVAILAAEGFWRIAVLEVFAFSALGTLKKLSTLVH